MAAQHCLEHGAVVEFEVVLFEHAHALAGALGDGAVSGGELSGKNAHQGGFARAVSADYSIAVAGSEFHIHILEKNAFAELYAKIIY